MLSLGLAERKTVHLPPAPIWKRGKDRIEYASSIWNILQSSYFKKIVFLGAGNAEIPIGLKALGKFNADVYAFDDESLAIWNRLYTATSRLHFLTTAQQINSLPEEAKLPRILKFKDSPIASERLFYQMWESVPELTKSYFFTYVQNFLDLFLDKGLEFKGKFEGNAESFNDDELVFVDLLCGEPIDDCVVDALKKAEKRAYVLSAHRLKGMTSFSLGQGVWLCQSN